MSVTSPKNGLVTIIGQEEPYGIFQQFLDSDGHWKWVRGPSGTVDLDWAPDGTITITSGGGGGGNVSTAGFTTGFVPVATGANALGDSLLTSTNASGLVFFDVTGVGGTSIHSIIPGPVIEAFSSETGSSAFTLTLPSPSTNVDGTFTLVAQDRTGVGTSAVINGNSNPAVLSLSISDSAATGGIYIAGPDVIGSGTRVKLLPNGTVDLGDSIAGTWHSLSVAGLTYPLADGTVGQAITTDGAGHLSFTTVGGGGGVTSITGTANQVIASAPTGAVTLSLPQSINTTARPTFSALNLQAGVAGNLLVGTGAGAAITTASPITAVGVNAAQNLTVGVFNTFVGYESAQNEINGFGNCYLGHQTGAVGTGNVDATLLGGGAGFNLTGTQYNTFIGANAGILATSAPQNTLIGAFVAGALTTGQDNVMIGYNTGPSITTGSNNILINAQAEGIPAATNGWMVTGSTDWPITDVWWGNGPARRGTNPGIDVWLHGSGAGGVDQVGGDLYLAGGQGDGTGTGGEVSIYTAPVGGSGSTPNALVKRSLVNSTGQTILLKTDGVTPATTFNTNSSMLQAGVAFASLGTPANGTLVYCTDCDPVTLLTCGSAGTKTGAYALRLNGAWKCIGA